jgi:leucyl aminopeptidase (aminopeptidase T)
VGGEPWTHGQPADGKIGKRALELNTARKTLPNPDLQLSRALATVVDDCLAIRRGESVLVVVDPPSRELGEAMRERAAAAGADAVLALMAERASHGAEPPPPVAAALAAADAFLAPASKSLSHTQARRAATKRGVRGATLPGVTADLLARTMSVDLSVLGERSRAVAERLDRARTARVTCPRGTDFQLDLSDRRALADDGDLTAPGAFGNLPCGEGFVSPRGGEGTVVASSLASIGLAAGEPARLTVEAGHLTAAEGPEGERFLAALRQHGDAGTNLAELGVGTNDRATLTGNVLEDEKILGTVHVAFGASAGIGGTVSVPVHLDCVVLDATLHVDGEPLLDAGELLVA